MTTATTPAEPVLYQLWHRPPGKRQRWRKAGRTSTRAEALTLIGGPGDWHIAPLYDSRLAGENRDTKRPGLFD